MPHGIIYIYRLLLGPETLHLFSIAVETHFRCGWLMLQPVHRWWIVLRTLVPRFSAPAIMSRTPSDALFCFTRGLDQGTRHSSITVQTKLCLYNAYILAVLLTGSEQLQLTLTTGSMLLISGASVWKMQYTIAMYPTKVLEKHKPSSCLKTCPIEEVKALWSDHNRALWVCTSQPLMDWQCPLQALQTHLAENNGTG